MERRSRSGSGEHRSRGFAYALPLVVMGVLAIAASASLILAESMQRRAAEEALLVAGEELGRALASYRASGGADPTELAELIRDHRAPGVRRHLRRVPVDPMTGRAEWGVIRTPEGRIAAIYSVAEGSPIKREGFDAVTQFGFEEASRYSQWQFGRSLRPASRPASGP